MVLGVLEPVVNYYDYIMDTYGDPRVNDMLFMSSPFPTISICLGYIFIVKYLGPKLMENREPFEMKTAMIIYNALIVAGSLWGFLESVQIIWINSYSLRCETCDFSNSPAALRVARAVWYYYFSKFLELVDTLFFVLRKKDKQISTLHVVHHTIMPLTCWPVVKFYPGGHVIVNGTLNTFVHIIMYFYYFLAAFGPGIQKYLWWKKYLTRLQLTQFVLIFLHSAQLFFIDCKVPILFAWLAIGNAVLFFIMFSQFYKSAYNASSAKSKTKAAMEKLTVCMPVSASSEEEKKTS